MAPTVDVIVPCYNYGPLLGACVASVLSQDDVAVRVLIMDDASTDETPMVGRRLAAADPRVEYHRHDSNKGHIATYNEALAMITADYCMILSADDLLTHGALSRATWLMEAYPSVGLTYGRDLPFHGAAPDDVVDGTAGKSRLLTYPEFLRAACRLGHTGIQAPTAVVRASVQRVVGHYRSDLPHTADTEIWLRMAACARVGELEAIQALRRLHTSNMSLTFTALQRLIEQKKAFDAHFAAHPSRLPEVAGLQQVAHRTIAESAFWLGAQAFDRGNADECQACLAFAAEICPAIASSRSWQRLRWKRWLGLAAWRRIEPLAMRMRGRA